MVTFIRTAVVNGNDKMQQATEWAKHAGKYVDGKFGFTHVEVGAEVYGDAGRIYWIAKQDSLESLARGSLESLVDPGYQGELMKGVGLFVPGSVHDKVVLGL